MRNGNPHAKKSQFQKNQAQNLKSKIKNQKTKKLPSFPSLDLSQKELHSELASPCSLFS